jgi:peptidyl-prolyl cis-trans isomerase SurA
VPYRLEAGSWKLEAPGDVIYALMNRKMLLLATLLAGTCAALPAGELVESIIARVNDRLITHSEFDKRVEAVGRSGAAPDGATRRRILDDMIQEKLLEEKARELSVSATDAEVEEAVERVKRQYNLATDAEFDAALSQSHMTREDLKRQVRETITMQKLIGREVTGKLDMSDDVLRLEYERQKEQLYKTPEQARVSEIVIRFSPDDAQARAAAAGQIEEARKKLAAGAPFSDVAREYSQGNAKERGGDLGTVARGELLPALDAAVFVDPPPVLLSGSMHLFHVTERKPAGYRPFAEVREDLKKRLSESLYDKRFSEYVEKLRHEAFVKIYDKDLAAAEKKG